MVYLTVYMYSMCSMNPLLYRAGRAWKRSTSRKRRQLRELLSSTINYLSICSSGLGSYRSTVTHIQYIGNFQLTFLLYAITLLFFKYHMFLPILFLVFHPLQSPFIFSRFLVKKSHLIFVSK